MFDEKLIPSLNLMREPHAKYCTAADNLQISSWCSSSGVTALKITGRFLTCEGRIVDIVERHAPNTDRTIKSTVHGLGEGWLLDLRIESDGAPFIGQVFARASIVRGLSGNVTPLNVLCCGVLNAVQPLAFPGSPITTTLAQPGILRSVAGTDPAAGVEISETVPTGARWRLQAIAFSLVTDATAVNRETSITFDDGTTVVSVAPSSANQAQSVTRRYSGNIAGVRGAAATAAEIAIALPDVKLPAGSRIKTVTINLAGGDNYGAPQMLVEEWLEGAA